MLNMFLFMMQMADFIECNYLHEQVEDIKELGDYITSLKRVGPGHGEYHFDRETLGGDS
jgi:ferritin heavy chain